MPLYLLLFSAPVPSERQESTISGSSRTIQERYGQLELLISEDSSHGTHYPVELFRVHAILMLEDLAELVL